MQAKTIRVKSHKRKGRVVRSHGRVKKENRLKKKGNELVQALEVTLNKPVESLNKAIKEVRLSDNSGKVFYGPSDMYKWEKDRRDKNTKFSESFKNELKNDSLRGAKLGVKYLKENLRSNFPYSVKRKKKK
jgi:hypothetical protein